MNELDNIYDMELISSYFNIPHTKFSTGLGPAFIYKFEPNIVLKVYNEHTSGQWKVIIYKKKVPLRTWFIPWANMRRFCLDNLNGIIKNLICNSCCGEWEDGFNT